MRALIIFAFLLVGPFLPAQGGSLHHDLEPGQLWVHRGEASLGALGSAQSLSLNQVTCVGRPVSADAFLVGGFIDVREVIASGSADYPAVAVFRGVLRTAAGLVSLETHTLEGELPAAWSPQLAFAPLPSGTMENLTREMGAQIWYSGLSFPGQFRVSEPQEVRIHERVLDVLHSNDQRQRTLEGTDLFLAHWRVSVWWDSAQMLPARTQTFLMGSTPEMPLMQGTFTLRPEFSLTMNPPEDLAWIAEHVGQPTHWAETASRAEALADEMGVPEASRALRLLAAALR